MKNFLATFIFAIAGVSYAVDRNTLWWEVPPTTTVYQAGIDAGLGNYADKRYALFMIDVNIGTNGVFTGFELKASTNNFSKAVPEDISLQFWSQSEVADTGSEDPLVDKMRLFACTAHSGSYDVRAYTYITNTIAFQGQPTRLAALVDAGCLKRHPDGGWLADSNEKLIWCYARNLAEDVEREKGKNTYLWRPVAPVRWYKEFPEWAEPSLSEKR